MSNEVGGGKAWELSVYELHRTAQEIISDSKEIAISPRTLHSELMCPICLDMLKTTMTTKECLHRFCQECIITALRSGNKECPTCRKKLVSKRSLRPDPNFDSLIAKIYPSREEYEAHQERVIAKLNRSSSQAALLTSIEEGLKIQSASRPVRQRKTAVPTPAATPSVPTAVGAPAQSTPAPPEEVATPSASAPSTPTSQPQTDAISIGSRKPMTGKSKLHSDETESVVDSLASGSGPESSLFEGGEGGVEASGPTTSTGGIPGAPFTEYEIEIRPHPEDQSAFSKEGKELPTRFVKTAGNATIEHIMNYLQMRVALDQDSEIQTPFTSFAIFVSPASSSASTSSSNQSGFVPLQPVQTLEEVVLKHWRTSKPLQLIYSVTRAAP